MATLSVISGFILAVVITIPIGAQSGSDFVLALSGTYDASETILLVDVSIDNNGGDMQGFNIDVCHDEGILDPKAIFYGPEIQALNGGSGPAFIFSYIDAPGGIVYGVVFSGFGGNEVLPIGFYRQLFQIHYDLVAGVTIDTELCFCNIPPCNTGNCSVAETIIVIGGQSYPPELNCFDVTSGDFLRGDANADGTINIADPIFSLSYLFSQGLEPTCLEAANANNDTGIDLGDALFLLNYINGMGPAPPAPFPVCGVDPAGAVFGCGNYDACP